MPTPATSPVKRAQNEDAPGLPDRSEMGNLRRLGEAIRQLRPYVVQRHQSEGPAGEHFDLRLRGPEGLYSWAVPKAELPDPGKVRKAIRQPLHTPEYADFEGAIEEGYGAGEVETERKGQAMITDIRIQGSPPSEISFTLAGRHPERYTLKKTDDEDWMLIGTTPTKGPGEDKEHYEKVEEGEELDELVEKVSGDRPMSVKVDGARTLLKIMKDKAELMSHRTRSDTGGPILHTERVAPELLENRDIPESLQNRTLLGELYATRPSEEDGREVLSSTEISGLLNSTIQRAREKAVEDDLKWRLGLFGAAGGVDPQQMRRLGQKARETFGDLITQPPEATDPQSARRMLEAIQSGKHELSEEGAVFQTPGGPVKFKPTEETDVIMRGITPGTGRNEDTLGALQYSLTPEGPVVGRVGSGLTDEMRQQIAQNVQDWLGRVARIEAQEQFPSGAYRAPRLLGFHEDYGPGEWGPEIEGRMGKAAERRAHNVKRFVKLAAAGPGRVFSRSDVVINPEALSDSDLIFLTGLSGSGKSTLAGRLKKELGLPVAGFDEIDPDYEQERSDLAEKFVKEWEQGHGPTTEGIEDEESYQQWIQSFIDSVKKNKKSNLPAVLEGAGVMDIMDGKYKNYPTIVKGTGLPRSVWRMLRREGDMQAGLSGTRFNLSFRGELKDLLEGQGSVEPTGDVAQLLRDRLGLEKDASTGTT